MILTVCPNPCLDITSYVDRFRAGALNRASRQTVTYSGKGINVAKGIRTLGGECAAAGLLPQNSQAAFEADLTARGIACRFTTLPGFTRMNCKIVDDEGILTEINAAGEPVSFACQAAFLDSLRVQAASGVAVVSGSLPAGCADEFYGEISNALRTCKKIFDTEGNKLRAALQYGATLVKPNLYELEQLSGKSLRTLDGILAAAQDLLKTSALVLVSLGKDGAVLTDGTAHFHAAAPVQSGSAVGAGDSMVAAAAVALQRGDGMAELLLDSVAAGAAAVLSEGTNLFTRADFERIRSEVVLRRL